MTADERLAKIQLKIDRAKTHITELERELRAFIESDSHEIGGYIDPETNTPVYVVTRADPVPPIIAVITGDVIHNLRSALDHLAYQLVDVGSGGKANLSHVYFPIAEDENKYRKRKHERTKGMHPDAVKALDALKPYKGGNDLLWYLHSLDIIDKHRLLMTAGSYYESFNLTSMTFLTEGLTNFMRESGMTEEEMSGIKMPDVFVRPADKHFPLKVGDILFRGATGTEIDYNLRFQISVTLGEINPSAQEPLIVTLNRMVEAVQNIVLSFKPYLG